jgi:hypothetical protein
MKVNDTFIGTTIFVILLLLAILLLSSGNDNSGNGCQSLPNQDYSNPQGC